MLVKTMSTAGMAEVGELSFHLDSEFKAGAYVIVCKDVTPGLPSRMQMKYTKILLKLVDLDPPPEEEKVDPKASKKKK